ncbi:hypothetical protein CLCR_00980 [Cladophialophora carrionii]|uniref:Uncharacterized protein n=1 Tax=Cladophialophora carrionii TaxID=86049 RepID=A0A1C1D0S1_9EURO|nr:hypothetical protein CLCR_00980 [Cladophialophora carrionii]
MSIPALSRQEAAFAHCGSWPNGLGHRIPDPSQLRPSSVAISPPVEAAVRDRKFPFPMQLFVAILRLDSVRLATLAPSSGSSIAIPLASVSVLIIFHLDRGSIPAVPNHAFTVLFGH